MALKTAATSARNSTAQNLFLETVIIFQDAKCFMHNSHFVHGILKYVLRNWNLINSIILAPSWAFLSETKFFVDEEYEDYKYSSTLPHSCYAALSHTTAFVNIISGHIYTVKQTMSDYYYIHSFDLTNSLKRSKGPPWTHRSCFENYCPTHPLRVIVHVTSQRNFTPSFVSSFNSYKLQYSTYILLNIVHYIISLSLLKLIVPLGQKPSLIYLWMLSP